MIPALLRSEHDALLASLAKSRLVRFRASTRGDRDAIELYLIDAQVAAHLHAAVRFAEVALREAMHRALSAEFGERWFQDRRAVFDSNALGGLAAAEREVGVQAPAGKVVAQLMLGTWVNLLGSGGSRPDGTQTQYVRDMWSPALKNAFPIPRSELRALAMRVNWARNRISHCEPVVFGLPMPGLGTPGVQVRSAPAAIFADAANMVQAAAPGLVGWMDRWERTMELFMHPLCEQALEHSERDLRIRLR